MLKDRHTRSNCCFDKFWQIKKDISTYLAKNILDFSYYEQLIGRNLNFRHEDETGFPSQKIKLFKKEFMCLRSSMFSKNITKKIHICC